jgi:hypothetical protein
MPHLHDRIATLAIDNVGWKTDAASGAARSPGQISPLPEEGAPDSRDFDVSAMINGAVHDRAALHAEVDDVTRMPQAR